jgi:hypothetical protein
MNPIEPSKTLGPLFPPAWHRPWLRYVDPVPGAETPDAPKDPPADPPVEDPKPGEEPPAAGETPPWGDDFDAERAWKRIQAQKADLDAERAKRDKAVKDAEAAAAQKAREDAYREFGKQLGVVKDDEAPTVESLTETLQQRDTALNTSNSTNASLRAENAVLRFADKHGADADLLLNLRDFNEKLAAIPTDDKYTSEVEALIKSTVESDSRYRKVQVAPRSSNGDPAPSGGDSPKDDIESLRATYRKERGVTD